MDVSVVIVNTQTRDLVLACLRHLMPELQGIEHEIFVVDNASTDGSVEAIRREFPDVTVIANSDNRGFARANNQALRLTRGEDILLLNPDTEIQAGALATMRQALRTLPHAAVIGPKILRPDGRLDLACRRSFPSPGVALARLSGLSRIFPNVRWLARYNLTFTDPDQPGQFDSGTAAAMLIERQAFADIGFFDEDFYMYGDDLDLCFRLKARGRLFYYVPTAVVLHIKGGTTRQRPKPMLREFHKSMWLFYRKHYAHGWGILLAPAVWAGIRLRHRFVLGWNAFKGRQIVSP
jgi:GT2 family glycosyltransferase